MTNIDITKYGYWLGGNGNSQSPGDGSAVTWFGGLPGLAFGGSAARIYVPRTGRIVAAHLYILVSPTLGSNEQATAKVIINNSTELTISAAVTHTATTQTFRNASFNQAVTGFNDSASPDYIEFKIEHPASYATNPTQVFYAAMVWIEVP